MPSGLHSGSDVIAFKEIDTGGQKVGNGGDGYSSGKISNEPTIKFDPYNNAEGSDVHVKTGDYVNQYASWDADTKGGHADASYFSKAKANGGDAYSNGDQYSESGHNTSKVSADTTAYQTNFLAADQSQTVKAGNGGDGGDYNWAKGGEVDVKLTHYDPTEIINLKSVPDHSDHYYGGDAMPA